MPHKKSSKIPKYVQTYPDHLATAEQLQAEGLKPGSTAPVALLDYQRGNISGTCGLHERSEAVPDTPKPEAP